MNQKLFRKLINISSPILITGPSGTGKSKTARHLFDLSSIHKEKFLTVHLASLKEELLESELFGHRKGAFTGAADNKNGYFLEVGKGTLFLDEIGELSLEAQKKLLYLLEEKKFTPVGATSALSFQGRLIMATNKDLKEMVERGTFREDLYFRLSVFQLQLQPIAEDPKKLQAHIQSVFEEKKSAYKKAFLALDNDLRQVLLGAPWKGNFRELNHCLEYIVAMSESQVAGKDDLPPWFSVEDALEASSGEKRFVSHFPEDYNRALEHFEALYLRAKLEKFQGRVNETARLLGISKTTLISKAKKYGIDTLSLRAEAGRRNSLKLAS